MTGLLLVIASGCASVGQPSPEATAVANATAERIFQSFNTGNYTDFSTNFSATMVQAVNESRFNGLKSNITGRYGKYVSKSGPQMIPGAASENNFAYTTTFENGTLIFTVTMDSANVYQIDGLHYREA